MEKNKKRYIEGKKLVESLKTCCTKCGQNRKYVIDFHHIDPSLKKFDVSKGSTGRSKNSILEEINKCVCLCRNCHTEFHYLYGNIPKNPIDSLNEYLKGDK